MKSYNVRVQFLNLDELSYQVLIASVIIGCHARGTPKGVAPNHTLRSTSGRDTQASCPWRPYALSNPNSFSKSHDSATTGRHRLGTQWAARPEVLQVAGETTPFGVPQGVPPNASRRRKCVLSVVAELVSSVFGSHDFSYVRLLIASVIAVKCGLSLSSLLRILTPNRHLLAAIRQFAYVSSGDHQSPPIFPSSPTRWPSGWPGPGGRWLRAASGRGVGVNDDIDADVAQADGGCDLGGHVQDRWPEGNLQAKQRGPGVGMDRRCFAQSVPRGG